MCIAVDFGNLFSCVFLNLVCTVNFVLIYFK